MLSKPIGLPLGYELRNRWGLLGSVQDKEFDLKNNLNFPETEHFSALNQKGKTFTEQKVRQQWKAF